MTQHGAPMTEPERALTDSGIRRKLLARKDDRGRKARSVFGAALILLGVYSHLKMAGQVQTRTIILIVLGGVLFDYRLMIDAYKAYKGRPAAPGEPDA